VRRSRFSALLAAVMGAVLVVSGCVPTASEPESESEFPAIDADAQALVEELRSLPFDESQVQLVTAALDAAGVAIADTWDPDAPEVVRITPWQAQNMAVEAANGGGLSGAELEAASPTPEGSAPIGYLISAWALDYDTDGARLAHALLGEQDFHHPESILFPSLVTSLFLADAAAGIDASGYPVEQAAGETGVSIATAAFTAFSPCAVASHFIQSAIATVYHALTVDTSGGGVLGFFGKIWNRVVKLAIDFVVGLVKVVTQPIVNLIVTVLSAVETIRQVSTFLMPWRSTLKPQPDTNRFGIDTEKVPGMLTLAVVDNRLPIPEEVLACGDLFGVDLREAGSAAGSTIVWTPTNMGRADLSVRDSASAELDKDQKAEYHYFTGQESKKAAQGDEHFGLLRLVSSVHRNDIEKVRLLLRHLVFDQLPASIRGIVESIAGPILDEATNRLTSLTDVRATGEVVITYHGETPPEPAPTESPAAKTWLGQWQSTKYATSGSFTLFVVIADGRMDGTIDVANSSCVASGTISGVADAGSVTFGSVDAGNQIQFQGAISADGTTMQGDYSNGDACGNDVGTWSARRTD
jgi:hypothetical protein